MAYKVKIDKISDLVFEFVNDDDAFNFISMVAEYGKAEDYRYEADESGNYTQTHYGWRPVTVHFEKVEEPETVTLYADGVPVAEVPANE